MIKNSTQTSTKPNMCETQMFKPKKSTMEFIRQFANSYAFIGSVSSPHLVVN